MTTNRLKTSFKIRRVIHFLMPNWILFSTAVRNALSRYPSMLEFQRAVLNRESRNSIISGYLELPNKKKHERELSFVGPFLWLHQGQALTPFDAILNTKMSYIIIMKKITVTSSKPECCLVLPHAIWVWFYFRTFLGGILFSYTLSHIEHMYIGLYLSLPEINWEYDKIKS